MCVAKGLRAGERGPQLKSRYKSSKVNRLVMHILEVCQENKLPFFKKKKWDENGRHAKIVEVNCAKLTFVAKTTTPATDTGRHAK